MNEWMDGCMNGSTDGWMIGWMDRWMDGLDEWRDVSAGSRKL